MTASHYRTRICNKCGWVHFAQTREQIQEQIDRFTAFMETASNETKAMYGYGPLSTGKEWDAEVAFTRYTKCFNCGNSYKDFHDVNQEEDDAVASVTVLSGHTIQGILCDE